MNAPDEKLTAKQDKAIVALLTEPTQEEAAKKAGVSALTLRRWLAEPAFQAAYREARRQVVDGAIGRLQAASTEAVETLRKLLTCDNPPTQARAAIAILEQSIRGTELQALAAQVDELEQALKETARGDRGDAGAEGGESEGAGLPPDPDGESPLGPGASGPGADHDGGEDDPGPMAGDVTPLAI